MLSLPESTQFNRRIPKRKFYEHLAITPQLKRVFVEQIDTIIWENKIAPSTMNVAAGETVTEIEIIRLRLNQRSLDKRVLPVIDKEIPYHILFLLEHGSELQAWIGIREAGVYYRTDWRPSEQLQLRSEGLNMDAIYENFVRQIADKRLMQKEKIGLSEAIECDKQRQKLLRDIRLLEAKLRREKQFNRQVEINESLKKMRAHLLEEYNQDG